MKKETIKEWMIERKRELKKKEYIYKWMNKWKGERVKEWKNERMKEWKNERKKEWVK